MANDKKLNPNDYYIELGTYIKDQYSVDAFKKLYKKYFDKEPTEELVEDYQKQTQNVEHYEEYDSYDDSYDSYW